ncbi:MAG: DUF2752 domain-containing protein [Actinomycetales bacterium]|nr:DUF2752 domain-containing protein [Actinomycetales bacterium]
MSAPGVSVRRDRVAPLVTGALGAAGTVLLAVADPHGGGYGFCPLLRLTGWYCPTCGGLRTTHDLATGDLVGAWSMNPLLTVGLPLAAVAWVLWTYRSLRGLPGWTPPAWLWWAIGVLTLVFGVLRNIGALHPFLGPS